MWGGPPGPRGSPWTRSFANRINLIHYGQAGQGAGRGPGVRPTIFATRPVMGKTIGCRLSTCLTCNVILGKASATCATDGTQFNLLGGYCITIRIEYKVK